MSKRLADKVAVVTGGGRGIGREYALALGREGAAVVINDLASSGDATAEVVAELEALGVGALAVHGDVSAPADVETLVMAAVDRFGGLDIAIANAGILRPTSIEAMSGETWATVMGVHVNGTFNLIHSAIPHLKARGGGSIVTTGSLATELMFPGLAGYRSAKAAIVVLTRYAAEELQDASVNVNAIMPGGTTTRMSDEFYASLGDGSDFLRSAERRSQQNSADDTPQSWPPETVPPLGVFLCTDAGRGITGWAFQLSGHHIGVVDTRSEIEFVIPAGEGWDADELEGALPERLRSSPGFLAHATSA
jgi:NAD(P)-dependent dehydrogenase (short-subunit alcohol dehydrogenase family)